MGSAGLRCLPVAAAVAAGCPAAHAAEEFPARPVRFFVTYAARGDSKPLLNRIHADVAKVMQSPALKASLDKMSMSVVVNGSPAEFQRFVLGEIKTWGKSPPTTASRLSKPAGACPKDLT